MLIKVRHQTSYAYERPSRESHNEVRLMPLSDPGQSLLDFRLTVSPNANVFRYDEPGGAVHSFDVRAPHDALDVLVETDVETRNENPYDGLNLIEDDWAALPEVAGRHPDFVAPTAYVPPHPGAATLARAARRPGQSVASYLIDLNDHLARVLTYRPGATDVHSTLANILDLRAGVCQDFAHLGLACCRSQGIPARYVSGYLLVEAGSGMTGEQGSHAWLEGLLPDGRWLAIDPTNGLLANDRYIRVHTGRDYSEVVPVKGVYKGPDALLTVSVEVTRLTTRQAKAA